MNVKGNYHNVQILQAARLSATVPTTEKPHDRVDSMLAFIAEVDPDRDTTATAVALRLRRAAHYIDTEVRRRLARQGFDLWELEILCALRRSSGTLSMGELMDIAQLTSGAITNRIARLEREGYVRRDIDLNDRRQVIVTLTPSGLEREEQAIVANDNAEREIFADIDRGIQQRLGSDLRELLLATEGPMTIT
jgi:DNA-binding MarR family transcriptional regulator